LRCTSHCFLRGWVHGRSLEAAGARDFQMTKTAPCQSMKLHTCGVSFVFLRSLAHVGCAGACGPMKCGWPCRGFGIGCVCDWPCCVCAYWCGWPCWGGTLLLAMLPGRCFVLLCCFAYQGPQCPRSSAQCIPTNAGWRLTGHAHDLHGMWCRCEATGEPCVLGDRTGSWRVSPDVRARPRAVLGARSIKVMTQHDVEWTVRPSAANDQDAWVLGLPVASHLPRLAWPSNQSPGRLTRERMPQKYPRIGFRPWSLAPQGGSKSVLDVCISGWHVAPLKGASWLPRVWG